MDSRMCRCPTSAKTCWTRRWATGGSCKGSLSAPPARVRAIPSVGKSKVRMEVALSMSFSKIYVTFETFKFETEKRTITNGEKTGLRSANTGGRRQKNKFFFLLNIRRELSICIAVGCHSTHLRVYPR